jgi:hypothetical protein
MVSYKTSHSDWNSYCKEEKFLDNLQRFNKKLERENISCDDKIILINAYTSDIANEYQLKVI